MPPKERIPLRRIRTQPGGRRVSIGPADGLMSKLYDQASQVYRNSRSRFAQRTKQERQLYSTFRALLDLSHHSVLNWMLPDLNLKANLKIPKRKKKVNPMDIEQASPTATVTQPTKEEMEDLLMRAGNHDQEALAILRQIVRDAPADWKLANSFVEMTRVNFFRLLEKLGTITAISLEGAIISMLDQLNHQKTDDDPIDNLLIEHIQMAVMATCYNHFLLMDGNVPNRQRKVLENRTKEAHERLQEMISAINVYRKEAFIQKMMRKQQANQHESRSATHRTAARS